MREPIEEAIHPLALTLLGIHLDVQKHPQFVALFVDPLVHRETLLQAGAPSVGGIHVIRVTGNLLIEVIVIRVSRNPLIDEIRVSRNPLVEGMESICSTFQQRVL